jgi:hypothetical protein
VRYLWVAIVAGFAVLCQGADKPAPLTLKSGDRLGVLVLIEPRATHQYIGRTIFGDTQQAQQDLPWNLPDFIRSRAESGIAAKQIVPVLIEATPEQIALRKELWTFKKRTAVLSDAIRGELQRVIAEQQLQGLILAYTDESTYLSLWRRPETEEIPDRIDNYGLYARSFGFGKRHA